MNYFDDISFSMAGIVANKQDIRINNPEYYGIQFFSCTKLYLRVDEGTEHRVEGSWAFLTWPKTRFTYGPIDKPSQHCWICFHGPRVQKYIETGLFPKEPLKPLIKITKPDRFLNSLQVLISMVNAGCSRSSHNRMVLLLEDILLQLDEQDWADKKSSSQQFQFIEKLLDALRMDPCRDWDFDKEAERINVTRNHFGRMFKDFSGFAPHEFLLQCRLATAAKLLISSPDLIKTVASKIGMQNEFYFSRLFKKQYHLSPVEYRIEAKGRRSSLHS